MVKFTKAAASDYDSRIVGVVPGYELMHELVPAMLASLVPAEASILVAGAGTGRELLELAARRPGWRMAAVDPSDGMLAAARDHVVARGVADRISFHVSPTESFVGEALYDAASTVLVGHFVPDDGTRARFFAGLARNLKPGAPLAFVDLAGPAESFRPAYHQWALARGATEQQVTGMFARIAMNFHPITDARLTDLLAAAGFAAPEPFFQALAYRGFVARRL